MDDTPPSASTTATTTSRSSAAHHPSTLLPSARHGPVPQAAAAPAASRTTPRSTGPRGYDFGLPLAQHSPGSPTRPPLLAWRSGSGGSGGTTPTAGQHSFGLPFEDPPVPAASAASHLLSDTALASSLYEQTLRDSGFLPTSTTVPGDAATSMPINNNILLRITFQDDEPLDLELPRDITIAELKAQLGDLTGVEARKLVLFGWPMDIAERSDLQLKHLTLPSDKEVSLLLQIDEDAGAPAQPSPPAAATATAASRAGYFPAQPIVVDDDDGDDYDDGDDSDYVGQVLASVRQQQQTDLDAALAQQLAVEPMDEEADGEQEEADGGGSRSSTRRRIGLPPQFDRLSRHLDLAASGAPADWRSTPYGMMGVYGRATSEVERALIGLGESDDVPLANRPPLLGPSETGPAAFAMAFARRHEHAPLFLQGSLREAVREARQQGRPLLLYLHDDRSANSGAFERMLCHAAVVSVLNLYFVVWGHDMTTRHNRELLFNETRDDVRLADGLSGQFPCLVVLSPVGSSLQMIRCLDEVMHPDSMARTLEDDGVMLLANMTLHPSSDPRSLERQSILEAQDAAYQASLEADRLKEQQRQAEEQQRREDAERQARADEEERQRQAAAAEAAASEQAAAAAAAEASRERLRPEPSKDDATAVHIRFQLPDGKQDDRRFAPDCIVTEVLEYAASLGFPHAQYRLRTPGPPAHSQMLGEDASAQQQMLQEAFGGNKRLKFVVEERS